MVDIAKNYASGVMQTRQTPNLGSAPVSEGAQFLQALGDLTKTAIPVANTELQKKIELDKAEQTKRAFQGLAPTPDATQSGMAAYTLVDANRAWVETQADIAQHQSEYFKNTVNPNLEDLDKYRQAKYKELLDAYPDHDENRTVSRYLSLQMQQAAPEIVASQIAAQRQWQQTQSLRGFTYQIDETISKSSSGEDMALAMPKLLATGRALSLDQTTMYNMLVKRATVDAQRGDERLLSALELDPLLKDDDRVVKARTAFMSTDLTANSIRVGKSLADLTTQLDTGVISEEQFISMAGNIKAQYGDKALPAGFIQSTILGARKTKSKQDKDNQILGRVVQYTSPVPMAMNPSVTQDDKDKGPKIWGEAIRKYYTDKVNTGELTDEQAQSLILRDSMDFTQRQQLVTPAVQMAWEGFKHLDIDRYKDSELPTQVTELIKGMGSMSPATLGLFMKDDEIASFTGLQALMKQMPAKDAMFRMKQLRDNPPARLDPKKLKTEVSDAVSDSMPNDFMSLFTGGKVPDAERERLKAQVTKDAILLYNTSNGEITPKDAAVAAAKMLSGRVMRTFNNTYISGTEADLFPYRVRLPEFNKALERYTTSQLEGIRKITGDETLGTKDIRFELINGNVRMLHQGVPVSEMRQVGEILQQNRDAIQQEILSGKAQALQGKFGAAEIMPHLIQVESAGNQSAVSSKGAVGVSQLMPDTGPEAAALAGVAWDANKFKTDSTYNQKLGQAYLNKMLVDFNNDIPLALAAYNAGPTKVRNVMDTFIEQQRQKAKSDMQTVGYAQTLIQPTFNDIKAMLPKETQGYVPSVLSKLMPEA